MIAYKIVKSTIILNDNWWYIVINGWKFRWSISLSVDSIMVMMAYRALVNVWKHKWPGKDTYYNTNLVACSNYLEPVQIISWSLIQILYLLVILNIKIFNYYPAFANKHMNYELIFKFNLQQKVSVDRDVSSTSTTRLPVYYIYT